MAGQSVAVALWFQQLFQQLLQGACSSYTGSADFGSEWVEFNGTFKPNYNPTLVHSNPNSNPTLVHSNPTQL